ncbi:Hypothetical predicted protein [Octopus vulgaris]|uniref:Kinetochore protein NDC80 n=1 Tax=Octopus vulgaris TaxID=6645 RepID=A0AA36BR67_OCTVU|nr:Hypothetical predicted protein [Octopus vulgaris]
MWRQSSSHKSAAPARVSKTSLSKPSASRLSSMDRLSSGTNSARFSLLDRMSFGKFSLGGKRMSHGIERGRMELRDPRPITTKAYQQRCVKSLLEFLESYGYPHSITAKKLMSPTTKDFLNVFEFIVKHIEFKYKLPEKFDEEIPRYLRSLGYPFPINKSSMFTIGSPHTWPTLLSALVWLTELIKKEEEQLQSQMETLEKEDAELSQEIWNKELEIGKIQEKLNEKSKQYNRLAQNLQLIPTTAENAGGLDFEMKPGRLFDSTQEQFKNHKENDQCSEKEAHIVRLKNNLERLKKDYKCDKQLHEQCIETKQELYDKGYEEMNENKKALEICTLELDLRREDLEKLKEQSAQEMAEFNKKEKDSLEFLQKVTNRVAEHKSRIKNNLETVSSEIKGYKERALETVYTAQHS